MKTLIIYNSVSGYTEKYAHILKNTLADDADCVALSKFKPKMLSDYDRAVFMARVVNNEIDGFKTVVKHAELFASKYTSIVAVGMCKPSADQYHVIERANIPYKLKGIPLFYVRGGFDADKLKGKSKLMINMIRSRLVKQPSRTPEEKAALNFLSAKIDKVDGKMLQPLMDYLESGMFEPPVATTEFPVGGYWVDLEEFMPENYNANEVVNNG